MPSVVVGWEHQASGTSISKSVNVGSGAGRVAYVVAIGFDSQAPSSVSVGSDSLTIQTSVQSTSTLRYALYAGPISVTGSQTVTATFAGSSGAHTMIGAVLSDADATTLLRTPVKMVDNAFNTAISETCTSASGDLALMMYVTDPARGATPGTGVTAISGANNSSRQAFQKAGAAGTVTMEVTLSANAERRGFIFSVPAAPSGTPIAFTGTVPTLNGTEGASFSQSLAGYFSGTETPFGYAVQSGTLPAGLSLNTSTGVISGTPTTAGTSSGIVVRGTDQNSATADTNAFSIVIAEPNETPSWDGPSLDNITTKRGQAITPVDAGARFSDDGTITFSALGTWPAGITVNATTGVISGTPTAAPGTYSGLQVRATDEAAQTADSNTFSITVQQCVLALNAAGYEFGDGNSPATMAVLASTELQVAAYPLAEWPPASAVATATSTTSSVGRLADLGDDDLIFGATYRVIARNAATGETWAWTMDAT